MSEKALAFARTVPLTDEEARPTLLALAYFSDDAGVVKAGVAEAIEDGRMTLVVRTDGSRRTLLIRALGMLVAEVPFDAGAS